MASAFIVFFMPALHVRSLSCHPPGQEFGPIKVWLIYADFYCTLSVGSQQILASSLWLPIVSDVNSRGSPFAAQAT